MCQDSVSYPRCAPVYPISLWDESLQSSFAHKSVELAFTIAGSRKKTSSEKFFSAVTSFNSSSFKRSTDCRGRKNSTHVYGFSSRNPLDQRRKKMRQQSAGSYCHVRPHRSARAGWPTEVINGSRQSAKSSTGFIGLSACLLSGAQSPGPSAQKLSRAGALKHARRGATSAGRSARRWRRCDNVVTAVVWGRVRGRSYDQRPGAK
jgi:hypothetical protein